MRNIGRLGDAAKMRDDIKILESIHDFFPRDLHSIESWNANRIVFIA